MRSLLDVPLGNQTPQLLHLPADVHSLDAAEQCIELAEAYGPPLDPSQKITLCAWMGTRVDGTWAARDACHAMSRQNGKGDELQARELFGLTQLNEAIIHTAHELPTAVNAFLRLVGTLEAYDDLRSKVKSVRYANGEQGIEFRSGAFIKYRARTGGGSRGFDDISTVVYDEAQHLQREHLAASSPTMAVHPNPQLIMTGSAGLMFSEVWWSQRMDALRGKSPRLAYVEHTAEVCSLDPRGEFMSAKPDATDVAAWAAANPAFGTRISHEFLESQLRLMGEQLFAREHLGVWDPLPAMAMGGVVPVERWQAVYDPSSTATPARAALSAVGGWPALGFAGHREDGNLHIALVRHQVGTEWVIESARKAVAETRAPLIVDPRMSPVLVPMLREAGIDLEEVNTATVVQASAAFVDDVNQSRLRHLGQPELTAAVLAAGMRPVGEAWVFSPKTSSSDINPLLAVMLAAQGCRSKKKRVFAY